MEMTVRGTPGPSMVLIDERETGRLGRPDAATLALGMGSCQRCWIIPSSLCILDGQTMQR
jgi:hypothetical protein